MLPALPVARDKELQEAKKYNLLPYFFTEYETQRMVNETDSVLQIPSPPSS